MNGSHSIDELFERRVQFPDCDAHERLGRLIGLNEHKSRLVKVIGTTINPLALNSWAKEHHPQVSGVLNYFLRRPPLVVLAGDVGSGKSELAENIGDAVARQENIDITLLPLSLSARGQGRVGEMTQLLTEAFDYAITEASKFRSGTDKSRGGVILLVDEADALAQSREAAQMHHEDRAGVNALIRGLDRIANRQLPAYVIMCTNRIGAIDPAVKRRAADILTFTRPSKEQRQAVLSGLFNQLGFKQTDIDEIVSATGPTSGRDYGFTFSDLVQRLLPTIVLDAYPEHAVKPGRALEIARSIVPTIPFQEDAP